jgi:hypothetical protein
MTISLLGKALFEIFLLRLNADWVAGLFLSSPHHSRTTYLTNTLYRQNLYLYLNRRAVKRLPCKYFHLRKPGGELAPSESKLPIAAYMDRDNVQHRRGETLRQFTSRRSNAPFNAIWRSKWKKIDPTEPLHDPYIVALLIAMAQQQRILHRMKPKKEATVITTFPVCLN